MAIRKFYSNKEKAGWRLNPNYVPKNKIKTQKDSQKKYYSWGYDIDLAPVEFYEDGSAKRNRRRESGFDSHKLANAAAGRLILAEKNNKYELDKDLPMPLLSAVFQARLNDFSDEQRGEKVRARRVLQFLLDALDNAGYKKLRLDDLTTAMMKLYAPARRMQKNESGKTIKDTSINRDLVIIRATLKKAKKLLGGLEKFVPPEVPFLMVSKTRREKVLHSAEVAAIMQKLMMPRDEENETAAAAESRRRAGLLFALSAVTGARPGELVRLTPNDILPDLKVLRITGRKTRFKTAKTVRYFPLLPVVVSILKYALEIKFAEYIFSQKGSLTPSYYDNIKTAVESCGLKYGQNTPGGIIPYDLRHTATTLLMQSGADFETVSSITGQSRHSLWHYTHASNASIDRAASVLETFAENSFEKIDFGRSLDTEHIKEKLSPLLLPDKS